MVGLPYGFGTPEWEYQQQQDQQRQSDERYSQSQQQFLMNLMIQRAQTKYDAQAQGIYNLNNMSNAQQSLGGTGFNLEGDAFNRQLRNLAMQGDINQQGMMNNRYLRDLGLQSAQQNIANQRASTDLARARGQERDGAFDRYRRQYGFPT